MLAFLSNLGPPEIILIAIVAILVFGKNLPEAAAKAVVQIRKFRSAVDDLKRDSGIEKEIRDIERSVREAEWEARRARPAETLPRVSSASIPVKPIPYGNPPEPAQPDEAKAEEPAQGAGDAVVPTEESGGEPRAGA